MGFFCCWCWFGCVTPAPGAGGGRSRLPGRRKGPAAASRPRGPRGGSRGGRRSLPAVSVPWARPRGGPPRGTGAACPRPSGSEVCKVLSRFLGDRQRAQRQDGTATPWGPRAYIPAAAPSLTLGKRPLGGELWGAGASSHCHAEGHPAVDRTAHSHREAQPGVLQHLFQADLSKSLPPGSPFLGSGPKGGGLLSQLVSRRHRL